MSLEPYALLNLEQLHEAKVAVVREFLERMDGAGALRRRRARRWVRRELELIDYQIGRHFFS